MKFFISILCLSSLSCLVYAVKNCSPIEKCISLTDCPSLKEVALKLDEENDAKIRKTLLKQIQENICEKSKGRLRICCNQEEISRQDEEQQTDSGEGQWELNQLTYHDLSGTVRIKDASTITIENFVYDGEGPDAFFVVGERPNKPSGRFAIPVPYPPFESNTKRSYRDPDLPILKEFRGEDIELQMPEGVDASKMRWLSLYCRDYDIDFGHVIFKKGNDNKNVPRN